MYLKLFSFIAFVCLILSGCGPQPESSSGPQYSNKKTLNDKPVYRFAVHPLHNPRKLSIAYQPLIDLLNRKIQSVSFELEASRDYSVYEAKFRAREPEFLLPNPWQTIQAMKVGYSVISMAGDIADFKGIFIVRNESPIRTPNDLKGKVISYPARTALAACILPQYYLHEHGININKDIENRYVGSQESSIMNAYLKKVDVAVTWPPPWRAFQKDYPHEAAELKVIWETWPLLNNSVMVRDDVPFAIREQVKVLLLGLDSTPEGRAILVGIETARFHPSNNASYDVVRQFIARFEKDVRPVETK